MMKFTICLTLAFAAIAFAETPKECVMKHCMVPATACLADAGCKTFTACAKSCTEPTCYGKCLGDSPSKATVNMVVCAKKNKCGVPTNNDAAEMALVGATPMGTYSGTKSVIGQHVVATVTVLDGKTINLDVEGPISLHCNNEEYSYDGDSKVTLPNAGSSGNCIHDALSQHGGKINSVSYDANADSLDINLVVLKFVKLDMTLTKQGDSDSEKLAGFFYGGKAPAKVTDCSTSAAHGKMSKFTVTPNPPVKGQNVVMVGEGTVDKQVTGGDYKLTVSLSGLQIVSHKGSVCGDDKINMPMGLGTIVMHGLECPQAQGAVTLSQTFPVSKLAPSGSIKAHFTATDESGEELVCMEIDFDI